MGAKKNLPCGSRIPELEEACPEAPLAERVGAGASDAGRRASLTKQLQLPKRGTIWRGLEAEQPCLRSVGLPFRKHATHCEGTAGGHLGEGSGWARVLGGGKSPVG